MNTPKTERQKRQNERQLPPISRGKTPGKRAAELREPTYVGSIPHLSLYSSFKEEMVKFSINRHLLKREGPGHLIERSPH